MPGISSREWWVASLPATFSDSPDSEERRTLEWMAAGWLSFGSEELFVLDILARSNSLHF